MNSHKRMANPYRILTLNKISAHGLKRFPADTYQVGADVTEPDAILVRSQAMHDMEIPASELSGRTLGIIGLGAIGRLVADAAIGLGMKVIGYDPEITVEGAWSLSAQVKKAHRGEDLPR